MSEQIMNISILFFKNKSLKKLEIKKVIDGYQIVSFSESLIENKVSLNSDSKAIIACIDQKEFLFRSFLVPAFSFYTSTPQSLIELEDSLSAPLDDYLYTFSKKRKKRNLNRESFSLCLKDKLYQIDQELQNTSLHPNFYVSEASSNLRYLHFKEKKSYPIFLQVFKDYTALYCVEEFSIEKSFEIEIGSLNFCLDSFERSLDRVLFLLSKEINFSEVLALCVVKEDKIKDSICRSLETYGAKAIFRSYEDQDLSALIGAALDFFEDDKNSTYFSLNQNCPKSVNDLLQKKMLKFFAACSLSSFFLFAFFQIGLLFEEKKVIAGVEKLEKEVGLSNATHKSLEDRLLILNKTLIKKSSKVAKDQDRFSLSLFLVFLEKTFSNAQVEYSIEKLRIDPSCDRVNQFKIALSIRAYDSISPQKLVEQIKGLSYIEDLKVEERGGLYEIFFTAKV
jgi:hypothetical protein